MDKQTTNMLKRVTYVEQKTNVYTHTQATVVHSLAATPSNADRAHSGVQCSASGPTNARSTSPWCSSTHTPLTTPPCTNQPHSGRTSHLHCIEHGVTTIRLDTNTLGWAGMSETKNKKQKTRNRSAMPTVKRGIHHYQAVFEQAPPPFFFCLCLA